MTHEAPPPRSRYRFTKANRLQHKREFDSVFAGKARLERGPLVVHAIPNAGGVSRLGLSVSRRVGNAVRRNRMKRLLRECFRTLRPEFPGAYDLIIAVRPHKELPHEAYCTFLRLAIEAEHHLWMKRMQRRGPVPPPAPGAPSV
ncbi:MAG: ribonuclease P protein component [Phycisphaerae bacterium]|nr:ribonuclease P protein component [Phycisphaerae bacterium]